MTFYKIHMILEKDRLVIVRQNKPGMYSLFNVEDRVILLSTIVDISKKLANKAIKDKYTFEIVCSDKNRILLKAHGSTDYESWFE